MHPLRCIAGAFFCVFLKNFRPLLSETDRNVGQDIGQSGLPIDPRVTAVAYTQLNRNLMRTQRTHEVDITIEQIVIVATINTPTHRANSLYPRAPRNMDDTSFAWSVVPLFDHRF